MSKIELYAPRAPRHRRTWTAAAIETMRLRIGDLARMSGAEVVALTDAQLAEIAAEHEALVQLERHIVDARRLLRRVGLR